MSKGKRLSILYGLFLLLFTVFVLLQAFVIPQSYQVVDAETMDYSESSEATKNAVTTETTYTSDGISVTLETYRENDTEIYVADVQLDSADSLKTAFAGDTYGKNITDSTSEIASDHNAILAINGDYYSARTGYVIRNGILYSSTSSDDDQEDLVIYEDGSMEVIREGDISAQELLDKYPDKTAKERERLITQEKKTVFLMQIGKMLKNGERHDGRAPDYDDWELNGDILVWDEVLQDSLEISSMGIRVDKTSLASQLKEAGAEERMKYDYHKMISEETLPLTIGGGIGQSRLCMLLLEKAHIGEVQVSVWPEDMLQACKEKGIRML